MMENIFESSLLNRSVCVVLVSEVVALDYLAVRPPIRRCSRPTWPEPETEAQRWCAGLRCMDETAGCCCVNTVFTATLHSLCAETEREKVHRAAAEKVKTRARCSEGRSGDLVGGKHGQSPPIAASIRRRHSPQLLGISVLLLYILWRLANNLLVRYRHQLV